MSENEKAAVETKAGKIEGTYQQGLYIFKGIPYAAPTVGERRWFPPEPVKPWQSVRQAQSFGNAAPQNDMAPSIVQDFRVEEPQSKDCLYLNAWSPGLDDARRPVLDWIHGGAFTMGSGSQAMYAGSTLARRGDAVIVTINYWLGILGFLRLNEVTGGRIPAAGNEGLLDQIAALEWVRDNIAAFGGDPDNVTVFGESAGAMSIGCLLAMPQTRGLFRRAILQSGAGSTAAQLDAAVLVAEQFLDILGLGARDVDALRKFTV